MIKNIADALCYLVGHKWQYKDYSKWKKEDGQDYDFLASRHCTRCNRNEYLYEKWHLEDKRSPYDIKRNTMSFKQLPQILQITEKH